MRYQLSILALLAVLTLPIAAMSQTRLAIEDLALNTDSNVADFALILRSKDLLWKESLNSTSKADLVLTTASFDKAGHFLSGSRQSLTVTADSQDPSKLADVTERLSAKVKIPLKTDKVRFLIQTTDGKELGAFDVNRKTINQAREYPPPLPIYF